MRLSAIRQSEIVRERTATYEPGVAYPADNYLGETLLQTAKLISADIGVRGVAVGTGGYDTHAAQRDGDYHEFLLQTVGDAVAAFYADLAAHGIADRVLTVVFSEFGRRPEENGDAGTDHGYGSVMFAVGDAHDLGVGGDTEAAVARHVERVTQRREEDLVVVVAADGDDVPPPSKEGREELLDVADGRPHLLGAAALAEEVAGREHHVDLVLVEVAGDLLEGPADVTRAVHPPERLVHVPVGGVEDLHAKSISGVRRQASGVRGQGSEAPALPRSVKPVATARGSVSSLTPDA